MARTGIAYRELDATPDEVLEAVVEVLAEGDEESQSASSQGRRERMREQLGVGGARRSSWRAR